MRFPFALITMVVAGGTLAQPMVEIRNNPGNAEVCWYAGAPLPVADVICQPGGHPLALPEGVSTVFARRPPDLVSLPVVVKGAVPRQLELLPAATLNVADPATELFAYIGRAGTVIPGPLVPAETLVLPLRIHNRVLSEIGEPVTGPAGKNISVLEGVRTHRYVVAAIERSADAVDARDPLDVHLLSGDKSKQPIVEVGRTITALAIFSDPRPGDDKLIVTGRGWKTVQRDVDASGERRVAMLSERIVATRVTKLAVRWWTNQTLADLAKRPDAECAATRNTWNLERDLKAPFAMTLLQCPPKKDCVTVRTEPLGREDRAGQIVFEDVTPGEYTIRVTYPGLPALSRKVRVNDGAQTDENLELRYFTFFGRVTYKGQPVRARLFATVTDDDGMYQVVLPNELGRAFEYISPCDGTAAYLMFFDEPPRENARFDVELPDATIRAVVTDEQTRAPLRDAVVSYSIRHPEKKGGFNDSVGKTDESGVAKIERAGAGREFTVCASHQEYNRRCSEPFVMKEDDRTVELTLAKSLSLSGRILTATPMDDGSVTWYGADGMLRESVYVKPDGTFRFGMHHQPGEILTVASRSHPLYVTRQVIPTSDKQAFEIAFPPAPERSFVVVRGAQDTGGPKYVSVAVGGVPAPLGIFERYLGKRAAAQPYLGPGSSVEIPSILATGPIELLVLSGVTSSNPDPAIRPRNSTVTRIPVGNAGRIDISNQ